MTGTKGNTNDIARLNRIFNRLSIIPEGREIVDFLTANKVELVFDSPRAGAAATNFITISEIQGTAFIAGDSAIHFSAGLSDDNIIQALVHESQHIRHFMNHVGHPDVWLDEEDHCLLRRLQEADCQTRATRIACLLKQNGDPGPYDELQKLSYGAMCRAFEAACAADPDAANNGKADRAAFDTWFNDDAGLLYYDRDAERVVRSLLKLRLWENPDHAIRPGQLREKWLHRIGALSPVNYMSLPGYPPVTGERYRRNIRQNIALFPD